jgi:hypothetical protein
VLLLWRTVCDGLRPGALEDDLGDACVWAETESHAHDLGAVGGSDYFVAWAGCDAGHRGVDEAGTDRDRAHAVLLEFRVERLSEQDDGGLRGAVRAEAGVSGFSGDLEAYAVSCLGIGGTELPAAERAGRALLERLPLRETAYALLMDALAAQGNIAQAMHVYDRARSILREELGITPGPTIQQAHARLLNVTITPP